MGTENSTSVTEFILLGLSDDRKTQLLIFGVILIIYMLTIAGNLLIILLVQVDFHLQTPMYFFLTHLSSMEICFISCTMPQMLAHLLAGNGAISFIRCAAQMYVATCVGCAECFLLAAMAYDRYLAICSPLLYAVAMDRGRQFLLTSASWASGFLFGSVNVGCALHLPYCGPNHVDHFCCEVPPVLKLACADTRVEKRIIFMVAALVLLLPLFIILTSYMLILYSVIQMRSAAGLKKAFSTCGSHLAVVTLFYGTTTFVYMVPRSKATPDLDKQLALFYVVITPLLNPIIYTLRNKDVHAAMAKILRQRVQNKKVAY